MLKLTQKEREFLLSLLDSVPVTGTETMKEIIVLREKILKSIPEEEPEKK